MFIRSIPPVVAAAAVLVAACGSDYEQEALSALDPEGLPSVDARCEVQIEGGATGRFSYDAAMRTLQSDATRVTYDERGRTLRSEERSGKWSMDYVYDALGQLIEYRYTASGAVSDALSMRYMPVYDTGVLTSVSFASFDGSIVGSVTFSYVDGRVRRKVVTRTRNGAAEPPTLPGIGETTYTYDAEGRLLRADDAYEQTSYVYDKAGRLTDVFIDGFRRSGEKPDGTPNIHMQWSYDAQGNLERFVQDGTARGDRPFTDGRPDIEESYSEGCSALRVIAGPSLLHLPEDPARY